MANVLTNIGRTVVIRTWQEIDFELEEDDIGTAMRKVFNQDSSKWGLMGPRCYPQRGFWNIKTDELNRIEAFNETLTKSLYDDSFDDMDTIEETVYLLAESKHGKDLFRGMNLKDFCAPFYAKLDKLAAEAKTTKKSTRLISIKMRHVVFEAVHALMKKAGSLKPILRACLDIKFTERVEDEPRRRTVAIEVVDNPEPEGGNLVIEVVTDPDFETGVGSDLDSNYDDNEPPRSPSIDRVVYIEADSPLSITRKFLILFCAYNAYRLTEHHKSVLNGSHSIGIVRENDHWAIPYRDMGQVLNSYETYPIAFDSIVDLLELGSRLQMFLGGRAKDFVNKDLKKIEGIESLDDTQDSLRAAIHYYGFYECLRSSKRVHRSDSRKAMYRR